MLTSIYDPNRSIIIIPEKIYNEGIIKGNIFRIIIALLHIYRHCIVIGISIRDIIIILRNIDN